MMPDDSFMIDNGVMLNAYPDSVGGTLAEMVRFLQNPDMAGVFQSFYILPSLFNTDLDRGFSVIDYGLNEMYTSPVDIEDLRSLGIDLKLDFILNHLSVLSKQFQDILTNGQASEYRDFFIDWNVFWAGHGTMTQAGYIQPDTALIKDMFFRKAGLPILMVRMPDGSDVPYWNTFYQEIRYAPVDPQDIMKITDMQYTGASALADIVNEALRTGIAPKDIDFGMFGMRRDAVVDMLDDRRRYLGQMDLNIKSPLVWKYYDQTLRTLADYGARIVRLDAFAYAPKEPGARNFLNEPGTWELLFRVKELADKYGVTLLPEIHASYSEGVYAKLAQQGYMTYDFFLPGLIIDALERGDGQYLEKWALELYNENIRVVNMLGCHDGIPVLDLEGLVPNEQINDLINIIVSRGGYVKELHGEKNVYYQVNATYYSALGEDDRKMLLARAIQLFMPGKPQVWYLDLLMGKNDHDAVKRAGAGGHKEINRTNLTASQITEALKREPVHDQLSLIHWRNTCPAFDVGAEMAISLTSSQILRITWSKDGYISQLDANLASYEFNVKGHRLQGEPLFSFEQGKGFSSGH